MNEKIDTCILRCVTTERESMPMFRAFGLDVTDQNKRISRAQIQEQLSVYFPDISDLTLKQTDMNNYIVDIRGYYDIK